jgi:hypothetical protein
VFDRLLQQKSLRAIKSEIHTYIEGLLSTYTQSFPIKLKRVSGHQRSSSVSTSGSASGGSANNLAYSMGSNSYGRVSGSSLQNSFAGSTLSTPLSQSSPGQYSPMLSSSLSLPPATMPPALVNSLSESRALHGVTWESSSLNATIQLMSLLNNRDEAKLYQQLTIHLKTAMEKMFNDKLAELDALYHESPRALVVELLVGYVAGWIHTDICYYAPMFPSKVNLGGLSVTTYYSLLTKEVLDFLATAPKDACESVNHSLFRIHNNLVNLYAIIEGQPLVQWGYVAP